MVTTFAGSGVNGSADGIGTAAEFNWPMGMAFDSSNNLYVTDWSNSNVRKITPAGVVTTLSGSGNLGSIDAQGLSAEFKWPCGAAVNSSNVLFVTDCGNHNIRKIE